MTVEENSNLAYGSSTAPGYTQVPQSPYLSASAPPMGAPYQQVAYPGGGGAPPPGVMYAPVSGSGVSVHVVQTQAVSNDVVGPIVVLLVGLCCPLLWLLGVIWWNATDTTARILGRVSVALCAISCCVSMLALGVYLIIVLALVCC